MLDFWLADENVIFASGFLVLIGLAVLQMGGVGDFGSDLDSDTGSADIGDGILSVLGIGRLPMIIWLALFVMLFSLLGFAGQHFVLSQTGELLSPTIAAPSSALMALVMTSILARPLARIMPKDETTVVSLDSLVGRFAFVEIGTARRSSPARAKVIDIHGLPHFIMVEPDNDDQLLQTGEKILLVRRVGNLFRAISHGDHHLPRLEDQTM
ncbi:MAG: YqiJ family protein [Sphingorhabdus sp.]|nr:YqiJ family protein [Sphingorhabdus sp.]